MTLPTSGTLTLSDIQTEFGGSNPIGLSEYYAGGSYVPAGTSGTNGAVPSSGTISISSFYGTSNAVVNFSDEYVYSSNFGATATAGYRVNTDGFDYQGLNGTYSALTQWVTPSSQGGNYEVYATVSSGTLTTGTTGSWLATSGNPTWTRTRPTLGSSVVVLSMQVRATGSVTVLDTWTVTLEAERT
jgi:hypothetical protein